MTANAEAVSHTPGPWKVIHGKGQFWVICDNKHPVCHIEPWKPDVDEADANLIAAAPKLLAAAKKVCAEAGPDMPPSMGSLAELDSAVRQATGTTDV